MLRARRIGSAWPLARTRIAWSRGAAPASIRRPISAAIQSASSAPGREDLEADRCRASATRRCGTQPLDDAGADLEPIRVVEPDQPIGRVEDRRERPVVPPQDDGPCPEVAVLERQDVVDRRAAERVDRLVVVADDGDVAVAARRARRRAPPAPGSCPGTRRRGCTGSARRSRSRAAGDVRTRRSASATWSPKSMQPFAASSPGSGVRPGELRLAARRPRPRRRPTIRHRRPAGRLGERRRLGRHASACAT